MTPEIWILRYMHEPVMLVCDIFEADNQALALVYSALPHLLSLVYFVEPSK